MSNLPKFNDALCFVQTPTKRVPVVQPKGPEYPVPNDETLRAFDEAGDTLSTYPSVEAAFADVWAEDAHDA